MVHFWFDFEHLIELFILRLKEFALVRQLNVYIVTLFQLLLQNLALQIALGDCLFVAIKLLQLCLKLVNLWSKLNLSLKTVAKTQSLLLKCFKFLIDWIYLWLLLDLDLLGLTLQLFYLLLLLINSIVFLFH